VDIGIIRQGALILEIDPARFLYPYLISWPVPSRSAEVELVQIEGGDTLVYLSELREHKAAAAFYRRKLADLQLPSAEVLERGWQARIRDYRGSMVLAAFHGVTGSPWYVISKIDVAEADAPVRRLGWEMALITLLILSTNLAVVGLMWRGRELRQFHEREDWFRAVANDTPAYLWMSVEDEEKFFINKPLQKFLGAGTQNFLDRNWQDSLHPEDRKRARDTFLDRLAARAPCEQEYRLRRSDGQYRLILSRALPRFSPKGEFLGYAGSLTDITGRREAEQQLRSVNAALAAELAERTRHEEEIQRLSARLIHAQEDERKRLARELHDDLSQQVAVLSIAMGNLKRQIPARETEARQQSDRIQQKLAEVAETVRRISHQLHPAVLEYSGLVAALRSYCQEFSALSGMQVAFACDDSIGEVAPEVGLSLYRITQEALQNAAKHAQTAEAKVSLRRTGNELCLTIEDRGIGMAAQPTRLDGLGLVSIRERTRLIGGTVEFVSEPNRGTAVVVKVPVGEA
jgi:PAS domain S-box-containing protein